MDGNHRLNSAIHLGLKYISVAWLHYDDQRVIVMRLYNGRPYPLYLLDHGARCGVLLPFKKAGQRFDTLLPDVNVPLATLRRYQELFRDRYPL